MKRLSLHTRQLNQVQLAWLLLVLMIIVYIIVMSYQSILRYVMFKATAFDLGNLDQVLWNTIHGHPFAWTNQGDNWFGPPTRLAQHVEPIILPLSLLYVFHADPRILLIFQTLVLATGALPVYLLTRRYLPEWPLLAAVMAGAYLISPALLGINIFDFHPVSLATPLLLHALLALTYKRYVWFLIAIAIIEPHFYQGTQHNTFWYRYTALGSTPGSAVINIMLHPWLLIITFVTLDRIYYLASLLRSTGFLALLAPEWLLPALPSLAINLLSGDKLLYTGVYHYNAAIIPFIMMAAIVGLQRLVKVWYGWRSESAELPSDGAPGRVLGELRPGSLLDRATMAYSAFTQTFSTLPVVTRSVALLQPRISTVTYRSTSVWRRFCDRMAALARSISLPKLQWITCAWLIVMFTLNYFILVPDLNIFWATPIPAVHQAHIQELLAEIPPDASVSTGTSLNPHLSERQYITVFPNITISNKTVEYIIVDLSTVFPEDKVSTIKALNQLNKGQFCTLKMSDDVILLGRRDIVHCP